MKKIFIATAQYIFSGVIIGKVLITNDGSKIIQAENDLSLILRVVDRYTSNTEFRTKRGMDKMLLCNFPGNKQIQLAKNSSYSPDYIDKLVF
jgi:hypothetical protein